MVSVTNYERMAWAKEGLKFIVQNPLGYGLVERSFGHVAKIQWPDSRLHQSHSGWIDLTLGIGIPGMALIMGALMTLLYQLAKLTKLSNHASIAQNPYGTMIWWVLVSTLIMWCTTEISQKVYFDDLIFWLCLGGGFCMGGFAMVTPGAMPDPKG
jgi:O-antigen ligase